MDKPARIFSDRAVSEERPPNSRRRLDRESALKRDAEVARLRRQGVALRTIGTRLGMSLSQVQLSLTRSTAARMERLDRAPRQQKAVPSEDW
jgi:hypothetical protein